MRPKLVCSLFMILYFSLIAKAQEGYAPPVFADSDRVQKMEAVFPAIKELYKAYAVKEKIPGLAFGIVYGGRLVYADGIGLAGTDGNHPVTPDTDFRIASMTKSFTAMAILKLRDENRLELDDPVHLYIPELGQTPPLTLDAAPVTIRQLLTHTAGFPEDNPWADRQLQITDSELLDFLSKGISTAYSPGTAFEYSNLGFALLGQIITRVTGKPFEQYISENILVPLGMDHTYWEYSDVPKSNLAKGYQLVGNDWIEEEILHAGSFGATGGLITNMQDFSRYMQLHLEAWPPRNEPDNGPLNRATLREMHQPGGISKLRTNTYDMDGRNCPRVTSYNCGLAWSKECHGRTVLEHSGGLPGYGSHWLFLPDYDLAIAAFTNLTYGIPSTVNVEVADMLIEIASLNPRTLQPSKILAKRQAQLMSILPDWKDAKKSGIFSGNFFLDNDLTSLQSHARQLFTKAGKIITVGPVIPVNRLRGYFVITGERAVLEVWFTLSPENPPLIQEYKLSEGQNN